MIGMLRNRPLESPCGERSSGVSRAGLFQTLAQATFLTGVLLLLGTTLGLAAEPPDSKQEVTKVPSQRIQGKVTAIVDGDTLYLDAYGAGYVVDLAGIDAPEKGQPYGDMAAQTLHLKVLLREVQLLVLAAPSVNPVVRPIIPVPAEPPQPGSRTAARSVRRRVCGIIYSEDCVNSQLVREGLAWHDTRGCPSRSLAEAQESAKKARRGLWQSDREPIPPWQWCAKRTSLGASSSTPTAQDAEVPDLSRFFEARTPPAVVEATSRMRPTTLVSPEPLSPDAGPAGAYWLTTGSGIRHNSKCRYYGKSKGRPCRVDEGRPCQKCGG